MSTETQPPIVVGIDGSESAKRAVDWAAKETAKRHLPLRIVHATASPASGYTTHLDPPEGYFAILEEEGRGCYAVPPNARRRWRRERISVPPWSARIRRGHSCGNLSTPSWWSSDHAG